ncbi:diiron oxygenase [Rhodococcus sp. NPDC058505]|uniref:diiron oxygenase n=1 Tax=unclassified Rhodococcus (in: high G+C Gram-positive bacteria) TaxID=192944 RepID=UPI0036596F43
MTGRLPAHDPADPVETAVIRGLVRSWPRRATVRRTEPDLDGPTMDDLFDPARADYPAALLPFTGHPVYEGLDGTARARIRSWAWIAYNKNVMDVEQDVVTPGFGLLFRDAFGTGLSDTARASVLQAMVDEEYHTLMHLNGSALVRRRRGWPLPDAALPDALLVRRHRDAVAAADTPRAAALTTLAYATVAETSIGDYLALIADDDTVQPVHRATIALHRRDECAHASVAAELLVLVHAGLDARDRGTLIAALRAGVDAFTATDLSVWSAILHAENVTGADAMLREVAADPDRRRFLQDCTAIDRLLDRFAVPGP